MTSEGGLPDGGRTPDDEMPGWRLGGAPGERETRHGQDSGNRQPATGDTSAGGGASGRGWRPAENGSQGGRGTPVGRLSGHRLPGRHQPRDRDAGDWYPLTPDQADDPDATGSPAGSGGQHGTRPQDAGSRESRSDDPVGQQSLSEPTPATRPRDGAGTDLAGQGADRVYGDAGHDSAGQSEVGHDEVGNDEAEHGGVGYDGAGRQTRWQGTTAQGNTRHSGSWSGRVQPEDAGRRVWSHVGALFAVVGGLVVLGVVGGLLWHLVAPRTEYVFRDGVGLFTEPVPSAPIAADGWFAVIALVAGVVSGSLTQALFHRRMLGAVIGLALGTVCASLLVWQVGHWFGAAEFERAVQGVKDGTKLIAPLDVRAKGVLTLWPLAAMLTIFLGIFIDEAQRWFARNREPAAPPPPRELPPIREAGNHTSSYPYAGPAGEQGSTAP